MKMRKIFLLLAGCFLGMLHASSQVIQEKRPISLNGVWQMCFYYSPSPDTPGQLRTSNSLKILSGDNRFCNLVMTPGGAVIIGYGTFGLTSDTFYTEYIEECTPPSIGRKRKQDVFQFGRERQIDEGEIFCRNGFCREQA